MHYGLPFLMFDFAQGHLCFHVLVFLFVSGDQGGAQTFELWDVFSFFLSLKEVNLFVYQCAGYTGLTSPSIRHCVIVMEHLSCRFCPKKRKKRNHIEIHLVMSAQRIRLYQQCKLIN